MARREGQQPSPLIEPVFYEAASAAPDRPEDSNGEVEEPATAPSSTLLPAALRAEPSTQPAPSPGPAAASPSRPITPAAERRVPPWRPWFLIPLCGACVVLGIVLGNAIRPPGHGSKAAPGARVDARAAASTASTAAPAGVGGGTPTTGGGGPAASAGAGPRLLLDLKRTTGPLTTQHFVVTGARWTLGWAFDCTGKSDDAFQVTIYNADGLPSTDGGVNQRGLKGASVAAYTSTGERYLGVQTSCVWAIRVTS